ncbi:MAG: CDP-alcohol phosphatidyltransferase family protein [Candidatus Kerfeldbacteria bacterium]
MVILLRMFKWPYESVAKKLPSFLTRILMLDKLTWLSPDTWCYIRVFLALVIILAIKEQVNLYIIVSLYWVAVFTDFIDGAHARATNQVSEFGAKLDPIADKFFIGIILLFYGMDLIGGQIVAMFLLVEGMLLFTSIFLKPFLKQRYGYPLTIGSNKFGKIKMFIQTIAVGLLLQLSGSHAVVIISEYLLWISIAFGIGSLLGHLYRMDVPVDPKMRIVTAPNIITLSSLMMLVPTGFAIANENWNVAIPMLVWIFGSDWVDGKIARRFNQETAFGAVLDPVRDYVARFFVITWFYRWFDTPAIRYAIIVIILVEVITACVNLYTAQRCRTVSLANKWGKYRAVVHYLILLVVFVYKVGVYELPEHVILNCFLVMLFSSLVALIFYVKQQQSFMLDKDN